MIDSPIIVSAKDGVSIQNFQIQGTGEERRCCSAENNAQKLQLREENSLPYYYEKGLRKVHPYMYTHKVHVKGRWVGRKILDVLTKEFFQENPNYYENACKCGNITINGKKIESDYVIKREDIMEHVVHRHEPPVIENEIKVIFENDCLLVVDKPPSIPVHATGKYNYNTLTSIVKYELKYEKLYPIHRLDRLTSGVCIMALNKEAARDFSDKMTKNLFSKVYIAKVNGVFVEDEVICDKSIMVVSHKLGLCLVSSEYGKKCITTFKRLHCNNSYSIIECRPETGRMHQIRVHLKYLGFPIVNDPIYSSHLWPPIPPCTEYPSSLNSQIIDIFYNNPRKSPALMAPSAPVELLPISAGYTNICPCCISPPEDPELDNLFMCLHCWKYSVQELHFVAPLPHWAIIT